MVKISNENLGSLMRECNDVFKACARRLRILDSLAWEGKVAEEFFKSKESKLPKPEYRVDQNSLTELITALNRLGPKLKGDHPVLKWLSKTQESYQQGAKLLLAIETKEFHEISSQIYGQPLSKPFKNQTTNLDLADSISHRMAATPPVDLKSALTKTAEEFAASLQKRLDARVPQLPIRVELTDDIASRATAGLNRVRIRRGSHFSNFDIISIFNHEVETHCLTSQNGSLQENCEFLAFGGPRTTMTQEGLAIFFEIYGHSLSHHRFMTLCDRTLAVKKVEDGANFIELYRWYKERAVNETEAFLMTQRVFRGAKLTGKYPLTKDVVYLAGLMGVYNFLRIAVKHQNRMLVESLVCGRIALEDVPTIAWMRGEGLLSGPKYTPWWLDNWETLLSYFSFSSFLNNFDLAGFQAYFDELTPLQGWDFGL
jgi:uncharacterized protein (TIGR02421 family)